MRSFVSVVAIVAGLGAGCATVSGTRVKPDDYRTGGVRYWLAMPYLLVRAPVEVSRTETVYEKTAGSTTLTPLNAAPTATSPDSGATPSTSPADPFASTAPPPASATTNGSSSVTSTNRKASGGSNLPSRASTTAGSGGTGGDADKQPPAPPAETEPPFSKLEAPAERAAPSSWRDAVEIAWLPDYCHQYALRQTSVLAGLKVKVNLADGWKLSSLESEADSTAVMGKVLDLLGTVATAKKDVAVEKIKAEGESPESREAGATRFLRKTRVTYLKPGLYPLANRKGDGPMLACDAPATISLTGVEYEYGEFWTELVFVPKS